MSLASASVSIIKVRTGVVLPALFLLLLCVESLFSQADTGRIIGTASDASGAVVPNVKVSIVAVGTNRRLGFVTDGTGRYSSGPLQPGEYRVEAEAPGFKH